ncbi:MAG: FAD-dependent oxidoreductase [Clostridiales bacterium]|nr:FAD-dependent oxidoreductase [Clostridiales bacterium]
MEITGEESVTGIVTENKEVEVQGVFIFRGTVPAESLIYGIKTENGIIITDKSTQTNIEGVFACGDCTGKPYQVAKAVGEGLVAGQAAARRKLQK